MTAPELEAATETLSKVHAERARLDAAEAEARALVEAEQDAELDRMAQRRVEFTAAVMPVLHQLQQANLPQLNGAYGRLVAALEASEIGQAFIAWRRACWREYVLESARINEVNAHATEHGRRTEPVLMLPTYDAMSPVALFGALEHVAKQGAELEMAAINNARQRYVSGQSEQLLPDELTPEPTP